MKKLTLLFAILFSLHLVAEPQHGVVYVVPNGTGTGASWSDALGSIQEAITLARTQNSAERKDVWVAAGEYEITSAINLIDSVNVYGSFVGTETAVLQRVRPENAKLWEFSNPTILKGNGSRLMQAGGHFDMETVIDGFIMQNGNAQGGGVLNNSGGGIVVRGNVVYQNCIIRNNKSTGVVGVGSGGGGAIMTGGVIRYCLIENNEQVIGTNGGGGIFSNPPAGYISYIENCVVRGNKSDVRGAGVGFQGVGKTYISNLEVYNNISKHETDGFKGGAGFYANNGNNRVINCIVYNNSGTTAVYYNGGDLYNNTIVKNIGGVYLAGNTVTAINNIVWGCTDITGETSTSISGLNSTNFTVLNNATYNPIPTANGWSIGEHNIQFSSNVSNGDVLEPAQGTVGSGPKFVKVSSFIGVAQTDQEKANLDSVNWSLNTFSPCVNKGMAVEAVLVDIAGLNRPQGFPVDSAKYDIGAYELPYFSVVVGEAETAQGEIYFRGQVLSKDSTFVYAKGSPLELFFLPKTANPIFRAYYTISTDGGVTFNGEEVDFKDEIDEEGFWQTEVHASFKVTVNWEEPSSVPSLSASSIKCFGVDNAIRIAGINKGDQINVYNFSGMLVHQSVAHANEVVVKAERGIYIVRLAEGVQKVVVK